MTPDNPFVNVRSRSFIFWFFLSIPVLFVLSLIFAIAAGIIAKIDNGFLLKKNLLELILPNLWIYGLISYWCWYTVKRSHLNYKRIIGKFPSFVICLRLFSLVIPTLMLSLGTAYILFYFLSFLAPELVKSLLEQKSFISVSASETYSPFLYNLLLAIVMVVVAPLTEEFLFRGIFLQRWATKWGLTRAIIFSSLAFGILHPNPIGLFIFGMLMALLYIKTRSLIVPIAFHSLYNGVLVFSQLISTFATKEETFSTIEQFRSSWWQGILLITISSPWIVFFIYKNWPSKQQSIPYLVNN